MNEEREPNVLEYLIVIGILVVGVLAGMWGQLVEKLKTPKEESE